MNEVQLNAIREADNYLRCAGLPTYSQVTAQPAEVSDADVWELWLRVCAESDNLSTRVMIANFARAILALRPQAVRMTRDDLKVLMSAAGYVHATAQEKADFINGFRNAEAHHGITAPAGGEQA